MPTIPEPTAVNDTPDATLQRLLAEQATAFTQELLRVANDAPDGQVLRLAELFVLEQGRTFLRNALQQVLQAQASACEKKGFRPVPVPVDSDATTKVERRSNS